MDNTNWKFEFKKLQGLGLQPIPVNRKEKRPLLASWSHLQNEKVTAEMIDSWPLASPDLGVALICGEISGGLVAIDIDNKTDNTKRIFEEIRDYISQLTRIKQSDLYIQKTQHGGFHIFLRIINEFPRNEIFAQATNQNGKKETIIETRGEGGYIISCPTPGYEKISGDIRNIQSISSDDYESIARSCKSFDEFSIKENTFKSPNKFIEVVSSNHDLPGTEFNKRGDIPSLLASCEWKVERESNDKIHFRRPGKEKGPSATFFKDSKLLYVFTTNAPPFEAEEAYSPFAVYTYLEHNGNFREAARKLAKMGFGDLKKTDVLERKEFGRESNKYSDDDLGNAQRFHSIYRDDLVFIVETQSWYHYKNGFWNPIDKIEYERLVIDFVDEKLIEFTDEKWVSKSRAKVRISAMADLAIKLFHKRKEIFDSNKHLINFVNGTHNLENGVFRNHQSEDYLDYQLDYKYKPEAECPEFNKFLNTIFEGDDEKKDVFLKLIAQALDGRHKEEKFAFIYGNGSNGKTTLINILRQVFPDFFGTLNANQLAASRDAREKHLAMIEGKRFVVAPEYDDRFIYDEAIIKQMTGGDVISIKKLYKDSYEYKPHALLIITGNNKPEFLGRDSGIWRRLVLVSLFHEFSDKEAKSQDEVLGQMKAERAGIFNLIYKHYTQYIEHGLEIPESMKMEIDNLRTETDEIQHFLDECCVAGTFMDVIAAQELYSVYCEFQKNEPERKPRRKFYNLVKDKGFEKFQSTRHKNQTCFRRIKLKS